MKPFQVIIEESAQADVRQSYDWGRQRWGKRKAQRWIRDLRDAILKQLRAIPQAFPLAPENDEFPEEIRQMIVGRYRVIFTINGHAVHGLHIRGPFINPIKQSEDDH